MAGNLTDMLSAIIPKVPLNCFTQCLQQRKMCSAIPTKACHHQEGLMMSTGLVFCTCGPEFHSIGHFEYTSKSNTEFQESFMSFRIGFFGLSFYQNLAFWGRAASAGNM